MAKSKAELEAQYSAYHDALKRSMAACAAGQLAAAIEIACQSWDHLDGVIQYARKYEQQASVEAIAFVLKYAPFLMDAKSLDRLEVFLKENRRVAKHANVSERLAQSRDLLLKACQLLAHLVEHSEVRQDQLRCNLGGHQDSWRAIAEMWESMGFITRVPIANSYSLSLVSRFDAVIQGKCPACGIVVKATKARLLDSQNCPKCPEVVNFVLL